MRVLIATDGSTFGDSVIKKAASKVWPIGSQLRVVTVVDRPLIKDSVMLCSKLAIEGLETAEQIAAQAVLSLERPGLNISAVVREGDAAAEIIAEALDWRAELIMIGTHEREGELLQLLGSVADTVTRAARCPVETVTRSAASSANSSRS